MTEPPQPPELVTTPVRLAGRRRSKHAHDAILDATLAALNSVGYHDLTIEGVASASGVGKGTVYRRWSSKAALVAEAVSSRLKVVPPTRTGDIRRDLTAALMDTIANFTHVGDGAEIPALASDLARDPALLMSFRAGFITPRRQAFAPILLDGINAGRLPENLDFGLLFDMWAGAILYRALLNHAPLDEQFAEDLIDTALGRYLPPPHDAEPIQ